MQIEPTPNAKEAEFGGDTSLVDQVLEQRKKTPSEAISQDIPMSEQLAALRAEIGRL
jgi:exonuclease VII large subunit